MDRVFIRLPELIYVVILSIVILTTVHGQFNTIYCEIHYYRCARLQCVHKYHVCDGINHCMDSSDETMLSPCRSQALEYFTDDYLIVGDIGLGGLYQIEMSTGSVRHLRIPKKIYPEAMKMDPVNKNVYWTDLSFRTISRYSMISHTASVIYGDQANYPGYAGLELDLDNEIIYISDARNPYSPTKGLCENGSIIAIDFNGNFRRTIIHMAWMIPRALALDKANRMLYWADWGWRGIYKISLTSIGVQPTAIVTQGLNQPYAFVVDFEKRVMFWGDAWENKIEMSNLDGTNRRVILKEQNPHYYAMTMTSSHIYFIDLNSRCEKYGQNVRRFDRYTYQFQYYSSQVFHHLRGITHYQTGGSLGSSSNSTSTITLTPCTSFSIEVPKNYPVSCATMSSMYSSSSTTILTKPSSSGSANSSENNLSSLTTGPNQESKPGLNQESKPGLSTTHIIIVAVIVVGVVLIAFIVTCGIVFMKSPHGYRLLRLGEQYLNILRS